MFKAYYYNKIISFTKFEINENSFAKIHYLDKEKIKNELNLFLRNTTDYNLNIYGEEYYDIPEILKEYFKITNAAGGVVFNKIKQFLYIKRLGYYDFPKGKIEPNETAEKTALREVAEECGINISDLQLDDKILDIYHIYYYNGNFILKKTTWFKMFFYENYELTPQKEENITSIGWMNFNEVEEFIKNTYMSLVELIELAIMEYMK